MYQLPKRIIKKIFDLADMGISQQKIAIKLHISKNTVNRYLNIRKNVPWNEWPKVLKELFPIDKNVNISYSETNNTRNKTCELIPSSNYKDSNFQPIQYLRDCRETSPGSRHFRYKDDAEYQFQELKQLEVSRFKNNRKFLDKCNSKIMELSFKIDEFINLQKKKQNQKNFEVVREFRNRQYQFDQDVQNKRDEFNRHMENELHNLELFLIKNEKENDEKLIAMAKDLLNKKLEQEKSVQETDQEQKINVDQKQKYQYKKFVSVLNTKPDANLNSDQYLDFLLLAINLGIVGYKMSQEIKKYFNSSYTRNPNQFNRNQFFR